MLIVLPKKYRSKGWCDEEVSLQASCFGIQICPAEYFWLEFLEWKEQEREIEQIDWSVQYLVCVEGRLKDGIVC